jgi:hypothetical protein
MEDEHYHLIAYICGHACTKPSPFEGWVTFQQIFVQRPDGCRYAVVQRSRAHPTGWYLCWDLLHDSLTMPLQRMGVAIHTRTLAPPPELWAGDSPDGLIMKAMALYERA